MACILYVVMIHLSEMLNWMTYNQVIVKSYGQHTYLSKTIRYSGPEFCLNATLLSLVLCCKHYITMYLDEYLTKLWFSMKKWSQKYPQRINMQYFSNM